MLTALRQAPFDAFLRQQRMLLDIDRQTVLLTQAPCNVWDVVKRVEFNYAFITNPIAGGVHSLFHQALRSESHHCIQSYE